MGLEGAEVQVSLAVVCLFFDCLIVALSKKLAVAAQMLCQDSGLERLMRQESNSKRMEIGIVFLFDRRWSTMSW